VARAWNLGAALFLFSVTAAVVVWQNSRLAVLWDLSYVLENSYRISLGDVPYRDFPFVHAPLTFLIQAAIIKLTGRVFWHHVAYCAVIGGLSTVITWRILLNVLRDKVQQHRLVALLLGLPLIPLGVYAVFPHPFYDPDCTFFILIAVLLLQQVERRHASFALPLLAGMALVVPLFTKQNTGLAFLVSAAFFLIVAVIIEYVRRRPVRAHLLTLAGAVVGLAVALLLIQYRAGLRNYWRWTIQFAAERRTPARSDMFGVYGEKTILLWLALICLGLAFFWLSRRGRPVWTILSALLIAAPFIWSALYLLRERDPSERADRLLAVWPVWLVFSFILAALTIKRRGGISLVLPFIIIGAIHGSFLSQQLWGSTYAIWPLLMILVATALADLNNLRLLSDSDHLRLDAGLVTQSIWRTSPPSKRAHDHRSWFTISLTASVVLSLLVSGACYVRSNERLSYASLDEGELKRSTLPPLKGLATRGDWLPNFAELVAYADGAIPRDEGILLLPGEDPFYYTTGRRPQFPVLLFDRTVNPYSPEEVLKICRERNIRWVVIKQNLQNEDEQVEQERERLTAAVEEEFEQVESLINYEIYRRKDPNQKDDTDGNDDDPN
jgi:hypothetical protein